MKLYKLTQSHNNGWYTYDSAVVVADSIEAAREIIPSPFYFYDEVFYYNYKNQEPRVEKVDPSWCNPKYVRVEEIGEYRPVIDADNPDKPIPLVINASYKAGFDESRYLDMRRLGSNIGTGKLTETGVKTAIETLKRIELQLHDRGLAELRYHLIEANRVHNVKRVQEYELKIRDYMNEEHEDWS